MRAHTRVDALIAFGLEVFAETLEVTPEEGRLDLRQLRISPEPFIFESLVEIKSQRGQANACEGPGVRQEHCTYGGRLQAPINLKKALLPIVEKKKRTEIKAET